MKPLAGLLMIAALSSVADALQAQGYSLRLDSRVQRVSFRGVAEDSVAAGQTVPGPGGGPVTADGIAVSCEPSGTCRFFRPGPTVRAAPLSQSAALTAWGFGMTGLSLHAAGRLLTDLGSANAWPGVEPAAQLLEAFAEFASTPLTLRVGRQTMLTRLGSANFDGARVTARAGSSGLDVEAYAGWGLSRATALPVTSPALNPLDEYRPAQRTRLYGASAGYSGTGADLRLEYQRELDGRSHYFVSERAALSGEARIGRYLTLASGGEYDIAEGHWGSADVQARYVSSVLTLAISSRHYRPHFDLWTIWGAFSPVPFNAVSAAAWVRPHPRLEFRARGERYWFEPAAATTPFVTAEDAGWRTSVGGSLAFTTEWRVDLDAHQEFGPGAASRGIDGSVAFTPWPALELRARGAALERPLEFRYDDASVGTIGLEADWKVSDRVHAGGGITRYWETRARPDAAAFDWSQTRLDGRLTLLFGGAAGAPLPSARRRGPSAGRAPS